MCKINEFDVDPTQVLEVNFTTQTALNVFDLVSWVLANQAEARQKFGLTPRAPDSGEAAPNLGTSE